MRERESIERQPERQRERHTVYKRHRERAREKRE